MIYANIINTKIINKYMKKNLVKKLINISSEKKYYFKGANIINIFVNLLSFGRD